MSNIFKGIKLNESKQDEKIAGRYDPDDFDAMVARVGQKAKEQEKKKPVDIAALARRLAAADKNLKENAEELKIGDPVVITGKGIEFEGATGEIVDFGSDNRFVIVNLYNHGKHSFHSSDVSFNDYADSDDEHEHINDVREGKVKDALLKGTYGSKPAGEKTRSSGMFSGIVNAKNAIEKSKKSQKPNYNKTCDMCNRTGDTCTCESVTESYDSEELANEVYAEFERIYPNLARKANEGTVHAAIMDVLNYGGDSNPSALAQDVARAVKQEMQQGLAEDESKPVNMKRWLRDFERREDNNFHTENVLAMAQLVGTPEDVATMKQLVKQHKGFGLSEKQFEIRHAIADRLRPLVKQKIADSQAQGVAEDTYDNKFDAMMSKVTSKKSLNTREALGLMDDLIYQQGASFKEALQQASMSFEIDPSTLLAAYKEHAGSVNENTENQIQPGSPVTITTIKGTVYNGTFERDNENSVVIKTTGKGGSVHSSSTEPATHVVAIKKSHIKSITPGELAEDLPPPENARKTQIAGTLPTYKKAADLLNKTGVKGKALDFGAGLGMGTGELGPDAHSYEPFPGDKFKPHFVDVTKIPDNSYHKIVNLNVLNVVPNVGEHKIRDSIVKNIGRVLAPGGVALVTTRGKDVLTIKGTPGEEPMSMVSKIGTYQKGFSQKELLQYIQQTLGDGFEVSSIKLGPAGVMIKKLDQQGDSSLEEAGYGRNRGYAHGFASPTAPQLGRRGREDDEGNSEFDDKMRAITGMIFYNNVDDPEEAIALGLKQTRTGKWFLRTGNRLAQKVADQRFGPGKVWYPKNESVAEEAESKPVNMKRWLRDFDRREDKNFHTENVIAIAKLVGSPEDIKLANAIKKDHMARGGLSGETYEKRQALYQKLWPLVKEKIQASQAQEMEEGKTGPGLWANIHAKRDRIKHGSGEKMRKPGSKGAPTAQNLKAARAGTKNEGQYLEETYHGDDFDNAYGDLWYDEDMLNEAEYQGRKVQLGKPMRGDVKKFKVYVKDPSTGNIKKVNFGDPNMRIKKSNPGRRKSFRARHHCENPGPRTKARYWSCRKW